jgi:hypothetical protein
MGVISLALWRGHGGSALALGLSLGAGFVAQDWLQALLAALVGRRSQAVSHWAAWQGWALGALALGAGVVFFAGRPVGDRALWAALLAAVLAGACVGLLARILQAGRGRKSLAAAALLLSLPALPFGALCFGFTPKALAFWVWPLAYYPAATLAAQSYIRGFPDRARWAGPFLAAALAGAAFLFGAWLPGLLLTAQAWRLNRSIAERWRLQPAGLPAGGAIRAFGREQATFGVGLTVLWVWAFK